MDEGVNMIVLIIFFGACIFFMCFPEWFEALLKWIDKVLEKGGKFRW